MKILNLIKNSFKYKHLVYEIEKILLDGKTLNKKEQLILRMILINKYGIKHGCND